MIYLSSKLPAIYNSAFEVKELMEDSFKISPFDSLTVWQGRAFKILKTHFCKKCKIELKIPGGIYKKFSYDKCSKIYAKPGVSGRGRKKYYLNHFCKSCYKKLKLK